MCCICGGGNSDVCYDLDVAEDQHDSGGYHCDYYVPDDCDGSFDTGRFNSGELCCACGGGSGARPERPTTTPPPAPAGGPAAAPVPVGECPNTREEVMYNGGCCMDFGPAQCPFHVLCRSGGCMQPDWGDRCSGGLCLAPSAALEAMGITTTTTTPPPCPATESAIRHNGGCCMDWDENCETPRLCPYNMGCLKEDWLDMCIHEGIPYPEFVCDAPSVALEKMGITTTATTPPP
jgi:hypothetical protein